MISPLLANIALSAIEERYERWVHHRRKIRAHRRSGVNSGGVGHVWVIVFVGCRCSFPSAMPMTS